jgi:dihydrofolate synthase / folylpolyglutamate synthase
MKIKTYNQAVNYLESFIGKVFYKLDAKFLKQHDPLGRMRVFLSLLGNPETKFKAVLIGGTSGKGSTSYLISHILTKAGYKTGLTLSPHLQKISERLQINEKGIKDKTFINLVNLVVPAVEEMKKTKLGAPSYFEILIGMAFLYFMREKVDIAVVEVGMGGEFDATNALNPLVSVLTNVSLDHTEILGKTVEKIAGTKVGIIKNGVLSEVIPPASAPSTNSVRAVGSPSSSATPLIVVSGVRQSTVIKIVENRCKEVGAKLNLLWRDFGFKIKKESIFGIDFDFVSHAKNLDDLKLSLLGQYQAENAGLAIKTVLELKKFGFKIPDKVIYKALATAFFPGRFEMIWGPVRSDPSRQGSLSVHAVGSPSSFATPLMVLDGAHNPVKMKEFLKGLKKIFPKEKKIFIVGFKFDKDIKKMLREITGVVDEIILTEFRGKTDTRLHASAHVKNFKFLISNSKFKGKVSVEKNSAKALKIGIKAIKGSEGKILVITGSLYLVGEIRNRIALL